MMRDNRFAELEENELRKSENNVHKARNDDHAYFD
jgi:hypothetical protein